MTDSSTAALMELGKDFTGCDVAVRRAREQDPQAFSQYQPCAACGGLLLGPLHRTSARVWRIREKRAQENGGTDPVTGVTLAQAERHLAEIEKRTS